MEVPGTHELEISDAILQDAADAITAKFPGKSVGEILAHGLLRRIGLPEEYAKEFGVRADAAVAVLSSKASTQGNDALFSMAISELQSLVRLDVAHDLDYLAGYPVDGARVVYIDRDAKRYWELPEGKLLDIARYLIVHEVVEKTLLDEVQFPERAYRYAHQIALRLERAALIAEGMPWEEYDHLTLAEVARISSISPHLKNVPPDLDFAPHDDMQDPEYPILKELSQTPRSLLIPNGSDVGGLFTVHHLASQIYHLYFHDPKRLATTMMRFQEFFESPKYKGVYFSREEFEAWFLKDHGKTYEEMWAGEGFNIPSVVLEPFYDGHFWPLTEDEKTLLDFFSDQRGSRLYLIATAQHSTHNHVAHEIAHALYYTNPAYKEAVDALLSSVDISPIKEFLATNPEYRYHESALIDETQAYLGHTSYELVEHGLDLSLYGEVIATLQELYKKYAPVVH